MLFVTDFFCDHIGYVFHDCNYQVVVIYYVLNYYVGNDELPLVRDSFLLFVTDFVHVPENDEVTDQHVILWGLFQIFMMVFLLVQGLDLVHDQLKLQQLLYLIFSYVLFLEHVLTFIVYHFHQDAWD